MKIDLNIQPRESITIPSILPYKEWTIRITKVINGYTLLGDRGGYTDAGHFYKGFNLRKHLADFKKFIDEIE